MAGKVVVITGASSGIGAALAKELGTRGYQLVLAARREQELEQVVGQSRTEAISVVTDVRHREQVDRLRDAALERFGHVDIWINNAGRGIARRVLELTDEDFDEMMSINVKSALYGMQAILPHFQERGEGHLIVVSSLLGRVPVATTSSAYNAAKAALNMLTANLRMDMRTTYPHIHVSLVMPGYVATDFVQHTLWGSPAPSSTVSSAQAPKPQRATATTASPTSTPPSAGPQIQTADQVAAAIASLIAEPKPELYTNPGLGEIVRHYYQDVGPFEDNDVAPNASRTLMSRRKDGRFCPLLGSPRLQYAIGV